MQDPTTLIEGFRRFQSKYFRQDRELFSRLRQCQQPLTLVIACCDSRVDPAKITDSEVGDLFVVRNVANLVPCYERQTAAPGVRSAIEFAIKNLQVRHVIVLGHPHCGGIEALMSAGEEGRVHNEFIDAWVQTAKPAKDRVMRDYASYPRAFQVRACEQAAIVQSLENLRSFPWVLERVFAGKLVLHGWYFDIGSGELTGFAARTQTFEVLVPGVRNDDQDTYIEVVTS